MAAESEQQLAATESEQVAEVAPQMAADSEQPLAAGKSDERSAAELLRQKAKIARSCFESAAQAAAECRKAAATEARKKALATWKLDAK